MPEVSHVNANPFKGGFGQQSFWSLMRHWYEIMRPQWGGTFYFYEDPLTKLDPAIISGKKTLLSFQL